MKRIRVILGWLLAGAVVNVGVAWGCALLINVETSDPLVGVRITTSTSRELIRQKAFGSTLIMGTHGRGDFAGSVHEYADDAAIWDVGWGRFDEPSRRFLSMAQASNATLIESFMGDARGWPWRSLWCTRSQYIIGQDDPNRDSSSGGIVTPLPEWKFVGARILPLRPIAIGFLLNTLVFAMLLWGLLRGAASSRDAIRHKHGRCLACGYDLQGTDHAACPECGGAIVKSKPA